MEVLSKLKQTIDEECNTAAQFVLISFDECDRSDLYIISFLLISFCSVRLLSFCHPSAILLSFCKTKDIFSSLNLIGHHFDGWRKWSNGLRRSDMYCPRLESTQCSLFHQSIYRNTYLLSPFSFNRYGFLLTKKALHNRIAQGRRVLKTSDTIKLAIQNNIF